MDIYIQVKNEIYVVLKEGRVIFFANRFFTKIFKTRCFVKNKVDIIWNCYLISAEEGSECQLYRFMPRRRLGYSYRLWSLWFPSFLQST